MKPNPLADYIKTLVEPFPTKYITGEYSFAVTPRVDIDEDGELRYWRAFRKFPNDFAAALNRMLPRDVQFVSYDHLSNTLTVVKL
jgi:hypothetical protein|tara:strand:- start:4243 stop:4497 length:255 start_codon:yes stop_codon:yes gene_type:complete